MVKALQKEDSPLTVRWLTTICRKSPRHRKGLLNYTCFEEKLFVILQKVQIGTEKKYWRKSKQQCRFETQNRTWWDPESEKQKMDLEATIKALKDVIMKKKLLANNDQDLSSIAKAAAFCRTLKQK